MRGMRYLLPGLLFVLIAASSEDIAPTVPPPTTVPTTEPAPTATVAVETPRPELGSSPEISILGAWSWNGGNGKLLITPAHFCAINTEGGSSPEILGDIDGVIAAQLYQRMAFSESGSHVLNQISDGGWSMSFVREVNPDPQLVGIEGVVNFSADENRMIASDGASYARLNPIGTSDLSGAWTLVSEEWDGLMCTTDLEYRFTITRKGRDLRADAASLYHQFDSQAGSYTTSEATLTRRVTIARDPRQEGSEVLVNFDLDGDQLTVSRDGQEYVWERVE